MRKSAQTPETKQVWAGQGAESANLEAAAHPSSFFEAMKHAGKTIEQRVRSSNKLSRVRDYCSYRSPTNV